jgi:hypothetical protein
MCVISMVMDHYKDKFPYPTPDPLHPWPMPWGTGTPIPLSPDVLELRKLINEFKEAIEKAKRLDDLLKQPDCIDPEKAKLLERVSNLERLVNKALKERLGGQEEFENPETSYIVSPSTTSYEIENTDSQSRHMD